MKGYLLLLAQAARRTIIGKNPIIAKTIKRPTLERVTTQNSEMGIIAKRAEAMAAEAKGIATKNDRSALVGTIISLNRSLKRSANG